MDTGPTRALGTRDPLQIAMALRDAPSIKRMPRLTRALLHSAHALSIPIKIGVRLVAKTQPFPWSIQHSVLSRMRPPAQQVACGRGELEGQWGARDYRR